MPSLNIERQIFSDNIGKEFTNQELNDITFDFGVELDEIYIENGKEMFKFDIPANRYDLLCLEGFTTALRSYLKIESFKDITGMIHQVGVSVNTSVDTSVNTSASTSVNTSVNTTQVSVTKMKTHERNHIACAIIKGINFNQSKYDSFISYQDKLHSSIGRNRSLVAIGTHDLSKINGNITYESINLDEISFIPLNSSCNIKGSDLEKFYSNDKKISKFFNLLSNPNKAVAFKCNGEIMSIPPIINSDKTKITLDTKDIFIEVTGTDFNKVNTTLKYILYNFRGESIETVKIIEDGNRMITPIFNNYIREIDLNDINKKLHLNLNRIEVKELLERMMHQVSSNSDYSNNNNSNNSNNSDYSDRILVHVPDVRSDILHNCDLIEDIAIAYGFNNFKMRVPPIPTVGSETPLNKFTDKLRIEMALSGYNEVLTLTLLSKYENIIDSEKSVILSNPKSKEYEVVRTSLLPGILKSISSNLHGKIPIKVFEIADVVLNEGRAINQRRACAVIASNKSLLEDVQGPLSFLLEKCGIKNYKYIPEEREFYLSNQSAAIFIDDKKIGSIGVLHPKVCQQFEIPYAASSFEINIEEVFDYFKIN